MTDSKKKKPTEQAKRISNRAELSMKIHLELREAQQEAYQLFCELEALLCEREAEEFKKDQREE